MGVMTEEIVPEPIAVEQLRQEGCQGGTHRVSLGSELAKINSEALNLTVVTYEFVKFPSLFVSSHQVL
jgi:hypothetical protein